MAATAVVRPLRLVRAPRRLSDERWPLGTVATEGHPLGHDAVDHHRPTHRPRAQRDPRLLRGRPEPCHPRDERLGRRRAGLVAEPAGRARTRRSTSPAARATSPGGRPRATNGHGCGPGGVSSIRSWTGTQRGARRKPRSSSCSPVPVRRRSDLRTAHGNRHHRSQYSL